MALDAQDITNVLTLVLAVGTVWLAVATHSMAKATREAVALQSEPYFAVDGIALTFITKADAPRLSTQALRVVLLLLNPGQVRITYDAEVVNATVGGQGFGDGKVISRRGVIHPKAQLQFFCPPIPLESPPLPGLSGEVNFTIAYWVTQYEIRRVTGRLSFTYANAETGRVEWLWLEGPSYA